MAKDESGPAPISEESIGYLEEVKKGKPRKFAMICKGTSVISLVIYKKGNVEKHKKEAKQSGKGQFYFGVVDGKGIDIRFVLARADGFESPPVKPTSLKGFLDESAELKCKPYFEIVDAAPLMLDEDDPLVARFLKLQEAALGTCDAHPDRSAEINALCRQIGSYLDQEQPDQAAAKLDELESLLGSLGGAVPVPPPPPSPLTSPPPAPPPIPTASPPSSAPPAPPSNDAALEAKLVEALKKFKPLLEKAIELHPHRKGELITSITQIRDELKNKQTSQAQSNVIALGKLLQSLVSAPPAPAAPPPPSTPPQQSADALQWKEKVAAWAPAIKAAIAAKGPNAADMMKLLAQANALSKPGGDMVQAIAKLTECHALATQGAPAGEPNAPLEAQPAAAEPAESVKLQERFEAAKQRIEPILQGARQARPEKSDALLKLWNFACDQSLDGNLKSANAAMEKLEAAIAKLLAEAAPVKEATTNKAAPISNVALQQSLLAWDDARKQTHADLQTLEHEILELFQNDPRLNEVTQNMRKLDVVLGNYAEELRDRLDDAYNAPVEEKPELCSEALAVLKRYRAYLSTDPFIKAVATNVLRPIDIEGILGKTLDAVAMKLGT